MRKAEKLALEYDPVDGFYLAFSGGKDSQAIYHLAQMAGVRFKAHMNFTSVDPAEVVRFTKRQYPDVERIPPKISIYNRAKKKGILPTRFARWCCAEYKETSGEGEGGNFGCSSRGINQAQKPQRDSDSQPQDEICRQLRPIQQA